MKEELLEEKLEKFKMSRNLFDNKRLMSINLKKAIKKCETKKELDNILVSEIIDNEGKSFCSYSIMAGLHYGVYNLYCCKTIPYDIYENSLKSAPSVEQTKLILRNFYEEIVEYLCKKYTISVEEVNEIMESLFELTNTYELYNNDLVYDINKIIYTIETRYTKQQIKTASNTIKEAIKSNDLFEYFDKIKNQELKVVKIIPQK